MLNFMEWGLHVQKSGKKNHCIVLTGDEYTFMRDCQSHAQLIRKRYVWKLIHRSLAFITGIAG